MERKQFAERRGNWIFRNYELGKSRPSEHVLCKLEEAEFKETKRGRVMRSDKEKTAFLIKKSEEKIREILEKKRRQEQQSQFERRGLSLSQAAHCWLEHLAAMGRSGNTIHEYEMSVQYYLVSAGDHSLSEFKLQHADRFLNALQRRGLSPSSIAKHCRSLNILFRFAHEQEYFAGRIPHIKPPRVPHKQVRIFEDGDYRLLEEYLRQQIKQTPNSRHLQGYLNMQRLHFLLKWTGIRRSEAHALMLRDIDLQAGILHLRCNAEVGHVLKNGMEQSIPIPQGLMEELMHSDLSDREPQERWWLDDGTGRLWYRDKSSMGQALYRAQQRAGIQSEAKTLHGYRATLGTRLAAENPAVAQAILRHAQIDTTIRSYVNTPTLPIRLAMDSLKWN